MELKMCWQTLGVCWGVVGGGNDDNGGSAAAEGGGASFYLFILISYFGVTERGEYICVSKINWIELSLSPINAYVCVCVRARSHAIFESLRECECVCVCLRL